MKIGSRIALTLALLAAGITLVAAYTIDGSRWPNGTTTFHVAIPASQGHDWSAVFKASMDKWNQSTAFTFVSDDTYVDPCAGFSRNGHEFPAGKGDSINSTDFRTDVCGNDFGKNVLAYTLTFTSPGLLGFDYITQTDILFNSTLNWDVYDGDTHNKTYDFGRVALHELGHALGLNHESLQPSIMAPNISSVYNLQPDDIAGANALYAVATDCLATDTAVNAAINNSLGAGDCRIMDVFNSSSDTSYVDVYRIHLDRPTALNIEASSSALDEVLIITDLNLNGIDVIDSTGGACDVSKAASQTASTTRTFAAGDYYLMVNTYTDDEICVGNTGSYSLTITDSTLPVLGTVKNASGAPLLASALFTGGATVHGSDVPATVFGANDLVDVTARIAPDPQHVGLPGAVYVLATLGNGARYMQNSVGAFVPFTGLDQLVPRRSGELTALEEVEIASQFKGLAHGLAGQSIAIYIGYALQSSPQDLYYGSTPIRLSIGSN